MRQKVDRLLRQYDASKQLSSQSWKEVAATEDEFFSTTTAGEIIHSIIHQIQNEAHVQIANIVSRCLQTCFEYQFKIIFETKRNQTEARLVFVKDGHDHDPEDQCSGGAKDVAAFATRLAYLLLSLTPRRKLLILDEPFKFLSVRDKMSEENIPRIRQLLEGLRDELDLQIIIVTHIDGLQIGKVIEL